MDLDLEDEMNLYLNNQNLLNTEVVHNNVPKSNDWVQNCLFNYNEPEFSKTVRIDKKTFGLYSLNRLGTNSSLWSISTLSEYIVWPSDNYRQEFNTGFEQIQGFPMVIGAIDGSHIPLYEAPSKDNKDVYMSCKQKYGIHLQGVVDHQDLFISYKIGWPASVEDYLIADSAYPLPSWVMPSFKDLQGLQAQQLTLIAHSKTRVVIEQAFGRLKARFPF
ncbi:26155_t:CDS:2 [Gigaspora rosea]|nr:26155_t:CDS:2 [Gigaspora rosea]